MCYSKLTSSNSLWQGSLLPFFCIKACLCEYQLESSLLLIDAGSTQVTETEWWENRNSNATFWKQSSHWIGLKMNTCHKNNLDERLIWNQPSAINSKNCLNRPNDLLSNFFYLAFMFKFFRALRINPLFLPFMIDFPPHIEGAVSEASHEI